jgi:hypothetical protein
MPSTPKITDFICDGQIATAIADPMAHLLFPDGGAVGKHVNAPRCGIVSSSSAQPSDCLVVGIARDTRFSTPAVILFIALPEKKDNIDPG